MAELNAERGRYWCELAVQVLSTPALRNVDVWLLNEFDLGMAPRTRAHDPLVCACPWPQLRMGLNSLNSPMGIEKSRRAQRPENRWSLHSNAMLAMAIATPGDGMPNMAPLFYSRCSRLHCYEKPWRRDALRNDGQRGHPDGCGRDTRADFCGGTAVAHIDNHQADATTLRPFAAHRAPRC